MIHFEIMQKSILIFILLMLFSELHSDEWIQFRGTMAKVFQRLVNYPLNGVEPRELHGKLIWMVLPWSSPICVDNQVLTNALLKGEELKLEVLALILKQELSTGIPLFQYSSQPRIHQK